MSDDLRLKVDYDAGAPTPGDKDIAHRLGRAGYDVSELRWRRSPSGNGWHLQVWLTPIPETAMEIVALQAILGSDPYREASLVQRARNLAGVSKWWRERWNVLYK